MSTSSQVAAAPLFSRALVFRLVLVLVLATLAYGALLFYSDARAIGQAIAELDNQVVVVAFGLALLSFFFRFTRWWLYLTLLDIRIRVADSVTIFLAGLAMSITPGKVGDVLKLLMLRDAHDVPLTQSASIIITERMTDLLALLLLGGFGLIGTPIGLYAAGASAALLFGVGLVMSSRPLGEWLLGFVGRIERLRAVHEKLLEAYRSLLVLMRPSAFVFGIALSLVTWSTQTYALFWVANAFPHVALSFTRAMVAYAAPLLAGTLAMIPGGLGLTEASMTGVLVRFGGASVPVATAIALVVRVATFWLAIALGFAALALWQLRRSRNRTPDSV